MHWKGLFANDFGAMWNKCETYKYMMCILYCCVSSMASLISTAPHQGASHWWPRNSPQAGRIQAQLVDRGLHWIWFIIYSYLFFSEWFPTEIFKIIIQPQSLQSLQEYSPHFGNLSGCEPQQVMATNITDCCPVFTGPSEVWSHHRCWLFTHCSGLKWPGAPGSLFWSRWKP